MWTSDTQSPRAFRQIPPRIRITHTDSTTYIHSTRSVYICGPQTLKVHVPSDRFHHVYALLIQIPPHICIIHVTSDARSPRAHKVRQDSKLPSRAILQPRTVSGRPRRSRDRFSEIRIWRGWPWLAAVCAWVCFLCTCICQKDICKTYVQTPKTYMQTLERHRFYACNALPHTATHTATHISKTYIIRIRRRRKEIRCTYTHKSERDTLDLYAEARKTYKMLSCRQYHL